MENTTETSSEAPAAVEVADAMKEVSLGYECISQQS